MKGKVCLITGANRGIGKEIARQLSEAGATVIMLGRDRKALEIAREEIGGAAVTLPCDLASKSSVLQTSAKLVQTWPRLDVLVHNAAVARRERHVTEDGIEEALAVNHVAPYLLTAYLLPRMRATAQATGGARIVQCTTGAFPESVDFDDLQMERGYDAWSAYQRSKLINLAWALDLGLRLQAKRTGVTMNAVLPGAFVRTDATREFPTGFRLVLAAMRPFMMSARQAARNVVHVATAPELADVTGELFMKGKPGGEPILTRDPDFIQQVRDVSRTLAHGERDIWPD